LPGTSAGQLDGDRESRVYRGSGPAHITIQTILPQKEEPRMSDQTRETVEKFYALLGAVTPVQ